MLVNSKKNRYYYDLQDRKIMLLHPHLADAIENGATSAAPAKSVPDYYSRKLEFLREHGLINPDRCRDFDFQEITAAGIREALANTPQVTFEITDKCNMKCEYCGYGSLYASADERDLSHMSFETAKTVIDYLLPLWNSPLNRSHQRNIYISFYGGEPLMNFPLMEKIIAYLDGFTTHHNRFVYTMTTNGLLLDKYADFLAQHNIRVLISLDGNEDNNSYRVSKSGDPLFSTIVENVGKLRDRYPDYFEKCVNFNAVFHNRNSVEDIHRFFKETFGKFPSVRELSTSGINEARKKEFWQMFANVDDSLKEAEDYSVIERDMLTKLPESENLSFFLQHNCSFTFHDYNALLAPENDCATLPTGTCFPFSKRLFVTAKGLLLPCERISFRHFFGEVKEGKVELDFEKLAARYNDMYSQVLPMCSRCFNNYACLQCLFHLSKDKDNSMNSCRGYMTAGDYLGGISGILSYVEENPDIYGNILKDVVVD